MLKSRENRLGGRICKILRHNPEMIHISMDRQGWVSVQELIDKFNDAFGRPMLYLTLPVLMEIVRTDSKQRYGLKRQGRGTDDPLQSGPFHSLAGDGLQSGDAPGDPVSWNGICCAGCDSEGRPPADDAPEGSSVPGYRGGKAGRPPVEKSWGACDSAD